MDKRHPFGKKNYYQLKKAKLQFTKNFQSQCDDTNIQHVGCQRAEAQPTPFSESNSSYSDHSGKIQANVAVLPEPIIEIVGNNTNESDFEDAVSTSVASSACGNLVDDALGSSTACGDLVDKEDDLCDNLHKWYNDHNICSSAFKSLLEVLIPDPQMKIRVAKQPGDDSSPEPQMKKHRAVKQPATVIDNNSDEDLIPETPEKKTRTHSLTASHTLSLRLDRIEAAIALGEIKNEKAFSALNARLVGNRAELGRIKKYLKKTFGEAQLDTGNLPKLPIDNCDSLKALEELIKDKTEFSCLISKLSCYGGSCLRSVVNNVMRHAISSEVAILYSMKGMKEKLRFMDLKLCDAVTRAVCASPHGKDVPPSEINRFMALNLTYAKDRLAGRTKASNRREQQEEGPKYE